MNAFKEPLATTFPQLVSTGENKRTQTSEGNFTAWSTGGGRPEEDKISRTAHCAQSTPTAVLGWTILHE